jgi:hypothetical protein
MSLSTTPGHLHSSLELRYAETTSSSSPNAVVSVKSPDTCQVADRGHDNVPDNSSQHADAEAKFILMFVDSTRIIPGPVATVVGVEHIIKCETWFLCPRNDMKKEHIHSVLMS